MLIAPPRPAADGCPPCACARRGSPPRRDGGADVLEIVIDPGQAFGTGAHATTRLCLELLLELRAARRPGAAAARRRHRLGGARDRGREARLRARARARQRARERRGGRARTRASTASTLALRALRPAPRCAAVGAAPASPRPAPVIVAREPAARRCCSSSPRALERPPAELIAGGLLAERARRGRRRVRARPACASARARSRTAWGGAVAQRRAERRGRSRRRSPSPRARSSGRRGRSPGGCRPRSSSSFAAALSAAPIVSSASPTSPGSGSRRRRDRHVEHRRAPARRRR